MNANMGKSEQLTGKSISFILDTGANSPFIQEHNGPRRRLTKERRVQNPNGTFRSRKAVLGPMKTQNKGVKAEMLIHGKLPTNVLIVTKIISKLGAVMLDKHVAALIMPAMHTKIRHIIHYFATRNKKVYYVNMQNKAICLVAI